MSRSGWTLTPRFGPSVRVKRRVDLVAGEAFQESLQSTVRGVRQALCHSERVAVEIYADMRGLDPNEVARLGQLDDHAWEAVIQAFARGQYVLVSNAALPFPSTDGVSYEQLHAIMPALSRAKGLAYLPLLNLAMAEALITSPLRIAAFLAQLAHESGELSTFREFASGDAYEGRVDLGNTQPGDGRRFKGRGPIQVTGRANYRAAGRSLGLDLEANPEMAETPEVGFRVSAWYWQSRNLNVLADAGDFDKVTRAINGGLNGKPERDRFYALAKRVFGMSDP